MMRGEGDASLMVQTMGVWNGLRLLPLLELRNFQQALGGILILQFDQLIQ
jgi:hypothetical protein